MKENGMNQLEKEELDPRVQVELNRLNQASSDINRLENEIDEARAKYRSTFSDASRKMEQIGRQKKKTIQRARPYYELKEAAVEAQGEALRAARQYQTANGIYRAAKETIALAELKLMDDQSAAMLSSAWQEMLNHATIRVMEAEKEKTRSEVEHHKRANVFADLEGKLQFFEKKYNKSIARARPYFELKSQLELKLKQQKQNVDDLQKAIASSKKTYSNALKRLEGISEEIHESRRQKILLMFPRQPGVGADSDSMCSSISEPNLDATFYPSVSSQCEDQSDPDSVSLDCAFLEDPESDRHLHSMCDISSQALPVTPEINHARAISAEMQEPRGCANGSEKNSWSETTVVQHVDQIQIRYDGDGVVDTKLETCAVCFSEDQTLCGNADIDPRDSLLHETLRKESEDTVRAKDNGSHLESVSESKQISLPSPFKLDDETETCALTQSALLDVN